MRNKIKFAVVITVISVFFPLSSAFAQEATPTTISSEFQQFIDQLKEQITQLQAQIEELQAQSSITKEEFTEIKDSYEFIHTLRQGATGEDVKVLQEFLKQFEDIYPEGLVTSYFGPLTENAVKRFQEKNDIVASGTPSTTGYGLVGPKTRARLNELITEGAGKSGVIPPGLLRAPALEGQFNTGTSTGTTMPSGGGSGEDGNTGDGSPGDGNDNTGTSTPSTTDPGGGDAGTTIPPTTDPGGGDTGTTTSSTLGPLITALSITPTSGDSGTVITFTITAEDPDGVGSIVPRIKYPGSSYTFGLNWQLSGATSGSQTFSEPIDQNVLPVLTGGFVIETVKATDSLGNVSTYYPDGMVDNASISTHSFTIPIIYLGVAPPTETSLDTTPPIISDIQVTDITYISATITWTTNEGASGDINIGGASLSFSDFTINRIASFTNLSPNYTYNYIITSTDEAGNIASSNQSFTTLSLPDITPPVISNIQATNITETTATITWTTDELADSEGIYNTVSPVETVIIYDGTLVTSHSIVFDRLKAKKTFSFTVSSTDANDNKTTSSQQSLTTPAKNSASQMSVSDNLASVIQALQQLLIQLQNQLLLIS